MAALGVLGRAVVSFTDYGGFHKTGAWTGAGVDSLAGGRTVVYFDLALAYRKYYIDGIMPTANQRILGQTSVEGTPTGPRKVRVYRRSDGAFIREVTSNPDGSYALTGLVPGEEYQVVALDDDPAPEYNDVIVGGVTPVP